VVTTVTVCEHEPWNGTNCWPTVETTVAVHGAMEIVVSALELPFCGGAAGTFELLELVEWASELETVNLTSLEEVGSSAST
jgi:hypothetical protein